VDRAGGGDLVTRVSIVVPAYNHARFLEQAIESVLRQTHPQVELIVLDDGSTDGTRRVLEKYGERFRWESQPNMGQAATLNKGWKMAAGDVLGYLSADDYLHADAVRRAVETLGVHPEAVLAYPDFEQVDEVSRALRVIRTPEFDYGDMLLKGVCPPGPGAFFRRRAFDRVGGWNESLRHIPDFEYWLRLGMQGKFVRIPQVLAYYRVHENAQSFSRVSEARAEEIVQAIDALFSGEALPEPFRRRKGEARANALLHAARLHVLSGRGSLGIARVMEALRADPRAALRPKSYRLIAGGLAWRLRLGGAK
jgi:glycosyltransferase involved in cell wall biosynthesis